MKVVDECGRVVRICCERQEETDRRRGKRRSVLARAKATRMSPFNIIRINHTSGTKIANGLA